MNPGRSRETFAEIWPRLSPQAQEAAQLFSAGVQRAGHDRFALGALGISGRAILELRKFGALQVLYRKDIALEFIQENEGKAIEIRTKLQRREIVPDEERGLPDSVDTQRRVLTHAENPRIYRLTEEAHAFAKNSFKE